VNKIKSRQTSSLN